MIKMMRKAEANFGKDEKVRNVKQSQCKARKYKASRR